MSPSGQPVRKDGGHKGRRSASRSAAVIAFVILAAAVGGYLFGLNSTYAELTSAKQSIQDLRPESQRLKNLILTQTSQLAELQNELARVRGALHAIMPSENTYNISPNQSVIVSGGHLTIGLVGPPGNDSVTININGKTQTMTTGDIVSVAVDPSMICKVGIQYFDMFKLVATASCSALKPNE
jgi:hypothetical protein